LAYNLVIEHLEGRKNQADGPSREPDYEIVYESPVAQLLATVSVEPHDDLMPASIAAKASNLLVADVSVKLVEQPMIEGTDSAKEKNQWRVVAGVLPYEGRMYVPAVHSPHGKVISLINDNPLSGHFRPLKTEKLACRDFYWPVMDSGVRKYVSSSEVCHRSKAPRHARHEINIPFEGPSRPWEGVTMDLVTDLPELPAWGYTGIVVIVHRLTQMAIYLALRNDID